ncbi:MAG: phosphate/phosphite/phosphonate ABC transporter substrate-binding protein, partial [Chromatiales bacterium]|nr:phosphate/phosphite/phosphonate ABC transporter substrate-binding protein [Chromatiales bacterium]
MNKLLIDANPVSALLFVLITLFSNISLAVASKPLIIGVTPFISTVSLFDRLSPLSQYISEKLEREVLIETVKTPKEFLRQIHNR